mgnify:FL=1
MYKAASYKKKNELKLLNFTHLMSIYESNYYNFKSLLKRVNTRCISSIEHSSIIIKDIQNDKHTRIFKLLHKFKYQNNESMNTFSIKPHLIFYMYNDAKLLEVKSLKENRAFENSIQDKIRLNLDLFYWIKSYDNQ